MVKNKAGHFIVWLVGTIVSLAIAFALIAKTLTIPFIPEVVTVVTGWIIVIGTAIAVLNWIVSQTK